MRVLTDRGSEYCGNPERHEYELYLAIQDVDHTRTKTKSPQTTDVIDKCFLAGFGLMFSRARREPCRAAFIVAPRLRRLCAPAWGLADSNRRRSERRRPRLARPIGAPDRDGS